MRFFSNRDGYTEGGLDVESAVNLFFKGLLLSPVFLLALYIFLAMLKHMIFHGVPSMNRPTTEQVEQLRERDQHINQIPAAPAPVPEPVKETEETSSALDRVMNPPSLSTPVEPPLGAVDNRPTIHEVQRVPFTIYDGPQDRPKYIEPLGWNGEILEDPFE